MRFEHFGAIETVAVVGAKTPVGREFIGLIDENKVPVKHLRRLAVTDNVDEEEDGDLEPLAPNSFEGVDVAFFCAGADVARRFAPLAADAGCIVVDDSGAFHTDEEIPLVVPQVNGARLRDYQGTVIATPVCGATPLALVLKPLADRFGLERVTVSTYQSASELGQIGYQALSRQTAELLNGQVEEVAHPLAFNCLPLVGTVDKDAEGSSSEERRIADELRRVLDLPKLRCVISAVRVPTFAGFGATVNVELSRKPSSLVEVRELLDAFAGVKVLDNPSSHIYPTNRECIGSDYAFVGRLRSDDTVPAGLTFWLMTDNLRKGTALNALECLETLFNYRRMS